MTSDGSGRTYAYDAENRLIAVPGVATYTYGPDGQGWTKTASGGAIGRGRGQN